MDYPKSVPGVGLVDGKFVDENQVTGAPGSLIPAGWGNSVTQEILAVIQAAGLVPDEANHAQMAAAIAALVERSRGSYRDLISIAGVAYNFSSADIGKAFRVSGNSPLVLPSAGSVSAGAAVRLFATGDPVLTVAGGAQFIVGGDTGNLKTSFTLNKGDEVTIVSDGIQWTVFGTGTLSQSSRFGASLAANGWERLPSGRIMQWGSISQGSVVNGVANITLPITFPNACLQAFAHDINGGLSTVGSGGFLVSASSWAANAIEVQWYRVAGSTGGLANMNWFAIGF